MMQGYIPLKKVRYLRGPSKICYLVREHILLGPRRYLTFLYNTTGLIAVKLRQPVWYHATVNASQESALSFCFSVHFSADLNKRYLFLTGGSGRVSPSGKRNGVYGWAMRISCTVSQTRIGNYNPH